MSHTLIGCTYISNLTVGHIFRITDFNRIKQTVDIKCVNTNKLYINNTLKELAEWTYDNSFITWINSDEYFNNNRIIYTKIPNEIIDYYFNNITNNNLGDTLVNQIKNNNSLTKEQLQKQCHHKWRHYTGFHEVYDYCENCDIKK
jgi:hypothetical protein